VRGKIKTVSWLSLTLVIMVAMMASLGTSLPTTNTRIYVDPSEVSGLLPSDEGTYFTVDIMISDVVDLWNIGFIVDYRPFVKTIVAIEVTQGDFLEDPDPAGFQIWFIQKIDTFRGEVKVGYARLPKSKQFPWPQLDPVGQDGSGLLATIKFKVISAGESPINLVNVGLHDRNGDEIGYQTRDGYFYGPTANLVNKQLLKRDMIVGETQEFNSKVKNLADVPLYVRVDYTMYREEDLTPYTLSTPGPHTLKVDGYTPWATDWSKEGSDPYLDAADDGNYIYSTVGWTYPADYYPCEGLYTIEDISLNPGEVLAGTCTLRVHVAHWPDGLPNDNVMLDLYLYVDPPGAFGYVDSQVGPMDYDLHWLEFEIPSWLNSIERIDNLMFYVEYWPSHFEGGQPDWAWRNYPNDPEYEKYPTCIIDAVEIVIPVVAVIQPGEIMQMATLAFGQLTTDDIGTYISSATCWYSYDGKIWVPSEKQKPFTWWVTDS